MQHMQLFKPQPQPTYEEIIQCWEKKNPQDVFSGNFLLNFVTNTNQIEGVNVDYNTTRELFESEALTSYTGDLRSVFSVLNNRNVAEYLNSQLRVHAPVTQDMIREVHRLLLFASMDRHRYEDNGERAGQYKVKDYCVGRYSVGSLPEDVEEDIQELIDTIFGVSDPDALKVATIFQCYFTHIHPFADGNGRTSRWLTNYILVLNGHPPVLFTQDSRAQYFKALEQFDKEELYDPMLYYLKEQAIASWPALREIVNNA